jgi:aminopeptidase N
LLRETLIRVLGRLEDPAVIAGARDRFARAAKDADAMPAAIRESLVAVVARHADAATWSEFVARAKAAPEPIEKQRLFSTLGLALDPSLAARSLELSLSAEVPSSFATNIMQSVSVNHPALAFDFAVQREKAVLEYVEAASRWAFIPSLALTSDDVRMIEKVRAYANRSVPTDARQATEETIAEISNRASAKERQLPALEAWVRGNSKVARAH